MKGNFQRRAVVFVLASCFAGAGSGAAYVPCDGCSTAQMNSAALSHGVGRVLVGNVFARRMQAYRVYLSPQPRISNTWQSAAGQLYTDIDNVSAQESAAFAAYIKFYNASPVGYHKHYDLRIVDPGEPIGVPNSRSAEDRPGGQQGAKVRVDPEGAPAPGGGTVSYPAPGTNVYSVINSGPQQNAFLQWVGGLSIFGITSSMKNAVAAASILHLTDTSHAPAVSFTVTFTDGSHIGVYLDTTQAPPQILVNEATAVDSHGNNVPATADSIAGSGKQIYDFTGVGNVTDRPNMYQQITSYGVNVPGVPGPMRVSKSTRGR